MNVRQRFDAQDAFRLRQFEIHVFNGRSVFRAAPGNAEHLVEKLERLKKKRTKRYAV